MGGVAWEQKETIVYLAESADDPPSVWSYDLLKKKRERIIQISNIRTECQGKAELVYWKKGNNQLRGALLSPASDKPVPVIVRVYGDSLLSKFIRTFGFSPWAVDNHHLFASHGYAVFLPELAHQRQRTR